MDEIERISDELFGQHVEQFRLFTDRIAQLKAENARLNESRESWKDNCQDLEYTRLKLEASNEKLKEAIRLLRRGLREEADKVLEE